MQHIQEGRVGLLSLSGIHVGNANAHPLIIYRIYYVEWIVGIITFERVLMERKENALCKLHTLKAVQIGCCISCDSASPICETKGCIKHH